LARAVDRRLHKMNNYDSIRDRCNNCSVYTFSIDKKYGCGTIQLFYTAEYNIYYFNACLKQPISHSYNKYQPELYLSYLLNGRVILQNNNADLLGYVQNETYWFLGDRSTGELTVGNTVHWEEITIRISFNFLKRHGLENVVEELYKRNESCIECRGMNENELNIILSIIHKKQQGICKKIYFECKLLELIYEKLSHKYVPSVELKTTNYVNKIIAVKKTIDDNLHQFLTIQNLCCRVGISGDFLNRTFKEIYKISLYQYAISARMEKAKNYLMYTPIPIYEIAEKVGYKNATHFTNAFKKNTGMLPFCFRKNSVQLAHKNLNYEL
jgi:AraC-like DNA-binding protein